LLDVRRSVPVVDEEELVRAAALPVAVALVRRADHRRLASRN
jgi:hypothetical protein